MFGAAAEKWKFIAGDRECSGMGEAFKASKFTSMTYFLQQGHTPILPRQFQVLKANYPNI